MWTTAAASAWRSWWLARSSCASRQKRCARSHHARSLARPHAPAQNKLMTKIVIALTVLMMLMLAGNFGLVWAVVVYNTPTTLSSSVLTAKATGDTVQVSSADFYYDSNGLLQLRKPASQVTMDWVSPSPSSGYDATSATSSTGRRRLLQESGSSIDLNSAPSTVDAQTTQFTPTCTFTSLDFYTNSSYFFTGTCTFTKLVSMRTLVLPVLSSLTSAQVGGSIIDAAAWKGGAQTVYTGCYNGCSGGTCTNTNAGSNMNRNILSNSTTLANCEALAVAGTISVAGTGPGGAATALPYSHFGFTGAAASLTGICYACNAFDSSCAPFQYGSGSCSNVAGVRVYKVLRSPNRYQISGPGALANSPTPIPGGQPAAPAWSYTTLVITRVDYVKNVFRSPSNSLSICQANLLRFYVASMSDSGNVTSVTQTATGVAASSSYIDVCLTPMPSSTAFGTDGSSTWVGNYTAHSTGKSSVYTTQAGANAYYDFPNVTGWSTRENTDFQSVLSYTCSNCPSGPYIDYSNLQYDPNLFEMPCTTKGITWRYRDKYSNQGCPAWDPSNPSAQNNCTWTTAESSNYGGPLGPKYCIVTMDAFTPNEPIYTFDNQLSFKANTGRNIQSITKTNALLGNSGVPPTYSYYGGSLAFGGLWSDYFNTTTQAQAAAISQSPWFTSNKQPDSLSLSLSSSSRRHLLGADPTTQGTYSFGVPGNSKNYNFLGNCLSRDGVKMNGVVDHAATNNWVSCSSAVLPNTNPGKICKAFNAVTLGATTMVCRCNPDETGIAGKYCSAGAPYCGKKNGVLNCFDVTPNSNPNAGSASIAAN